MKSFIEHLWSERKGETVVVATFVVAVLIIVVMVQFTVPQKLTPSDTIQAATIILLLVVTMAYAVSAWKQSETSRRAVEVALRAEKNAVMPVVKLEVVTGSPGRFRIRCYNVGKGPALSLLIRGDYDSGDWTDDSTGGRATVALLGASLWEICTVRIPSSSTVDGAMTIGFRFEGHYLDIYGRRFCSVLCVTTSTDLKSTSQSKFFLQLPEEEKSEIEPPAT